jgi:O-methyltransferase
MNATGQALQPMQREHLIKAGHFCKGIAATCQIEVEGVGYWTVDTTSSPIQPIEAARGDAELCIKGSASLLHAWLRGTPPSRLAALGNFELHGPSDVIARFRERMETASYSVVYSVLSEYVTDAAFVFMNNGYTDGAEIALDGNDLKWRYSIFLIHRLAHNLDLRGKHVLDIGCGRGGACSYMKRAFAPAAVTGIDLNPGNIRFCQRVHGPHIGNFVVGDATSLPFAAGSFDIVTNMESSHGYRSLPDFFSNVARVLRKGGLLLWTDAFEAERLPGVWRAAEEAGALMLEKADITRNVIDAMRAFRDDYRIAMRKLRTVDNRWVIDELLDGYEMILHRYLTNDLSYWVARMRFDQ